MNDTKETRAAWAQGYSDAVFIITYAEWIFDLVEMNREFGQETEAAQFERLHNALSKAREIMKENGLEPEGIIIARGLIHKARADYNELDTPDLRKGFEEYFEEIQEQYEKIFHRSGEQK